MIDNEHPRELLGRSIHRSFFGRFKGLTEIQKLGIPVILNGKSVLLVAGTASGKTEAVTAPLISRFFRADKKAVCKILIVSPTKALVNDLYKRISQTISEDGFTVARKTSDFTIQAYDLGASSPPHILITTPEGLDSLIQNKSYLLLHLGALVIDEIHTLVGNPRGDQLRMVIHRLERFITANSGTSLKSPSNTSGILQKVAISATVSDPIDILTTYLDARAELVKASKQKAIEAQVIISSKNETGLAESIIKHSRSSLEAKKILVFMNSRKGVDITTDSLRCPANEIGYRLFSHHGSLSTQKRHDTEKLFAEARTAICVATTSMGVGIDIGSIDLVVCLDLPYSLEDLIQKTGRSGRRGQSPRAIFVVKSLAEELLLKAYLFWARKGLFPKKNQENFNVSVLVQQILATFKQSQERTVTTDQLSDIFLSNIRPTITDEMIKFTIDSMIRTDFLCVRGTILQMKGRGFEFLEDSRLAYSNIDTTKSGRSAIDVKTGKTIAKITSRHSSGSIIALAGQRFQAVSGSKKTTQLLRPLGSWEETSGSELVSYDVNPKPPLTQADGEILRGFLNISDDALLIHESRKGRGIIVWTWFGQLYNEIFVDVLKRSGIKAECIGSFAINVHGIPIDSIDSLRKLKLSIPSILESAEQMKIEKLIPLGPSSKLLDEEYLNFCRRMAINPQVILSRLSSGKFLAIDSKNELFAQLELLSNI